MGTSEEKRGAVLPPFADLSPWFFHADRRVQKASLVGEQVREVRNVLSYLSFKM